MRNKLGLVQIKVRAKDTTDIDLSQVTSDKVVIDGDLNYSLGGKLVSLDVFLEDSENQEYITYNGVTSLNEFNEITAIGYNTEEPCAVAIIIRFSLLDGKWLCTCNNLV